MLDVLGVVCWVVSCGMIVLRWKRFTSVTLEMCRDLMRVWYIEIAIEKGKTMTQPTLDTTSIPHVAGICFAVILLVFSLYSFYAAYSIYKQKTIELNKKIKEKNKETKTKMKSVPQPEKSKLRKEFQRDVTVMRKTAQQEMKDDASQLVLIGVGCFVAFFITLIVVSST